MPANMLRLLWPFSTHRTCVCQKISLKFQRKHKKTIFNPLTSVGPSGYGRSFGWFQSLSVLNQPDLLSLRRRMQRSVHPVPRSPSPSPSDPRASLGHQLDQALTAQVQQRLIWPWKFWNRLRKSTKMFSRCFPLFSGHHQRSMGHIATQRHLPDSLMTWTPCFRVQLDALRCKILSSLTWTPCLSSSCS